VSPAQPTTDLCRSTADDVFVRGRSLTRELIGRVTFTEMMFFQILGRDPTPAETAVLDGCLVALMEHGLTPSAVSTRLTYGSAPEALQGAVAAGLLGVGGQFVGTMEDCARLLAEVVAAKDGDAAAREVARRHVGAGRHLPGFGHPVHRPEDPRALALLALAGKHGVRARHCEALEALSRAVDAERGSHLPINATGATAAVLGDCGVPSEIMRGFALISRCAGLVGHVHEEQRNPAMRALWQGAEQAVPYADRHRS
jgi:citrate synthase